MCYNQTGDISTLEGTPLKLVDKFTYLGSSVESTEKDIETRLTKAWTAINRLSIIWQSDLTDKMKRSFFQAAVTSILLYGCTTWTLTKRLEKKLDGNYTRMLRAILNKSWQQHPTRHQLYGLLPPITKTIQVRRTRHAGHCWRSRDELISDVLLWIPTHGRAKAGRPARTYIQQLCEDTGCCPEDLPRAMNDREEWRERVRDIRATSAMMMMMMMMSFELKEIAVLLRQGVRRIPRIILANCELSVSSIRSLRVCFVCLGAVGMFSWRYYEQKTQRAARPGALADTCALTGWGEKKKRTVHFSRGSKRFWWEFIFDAKKPIFSGVCGLRFLSDIVIFVFIYIISCLFNLIFLFFMLSFSPNVLLLRRGKQSTQIDRLS